MGKIFFDFTDWSGLMLMILVASFFGLNFFNCVEQATFLVVLGVFLLIIYKVKHLVLRHYVKLRKKSIYIKLNGKKGFKIERSIIKSHEFLFNTLIITTNNNDCYAFNTKDICKHELDCLNNFLNSVILSNASILNFSKHERNN
jgi:hypothetical protein